jgi:hypothetical protein
MLLILSPGIFLLAWVIINYLFIWKEELSGLTLSALLMFAIPALLAGLAAGALAYFDTRAKQSSQPPSGSLLGSLALLLAILIILACFGLTWFAFGMLATG